MGATKVYNPNTSQWELSTGAIASDVQSVNGLVGNVVLDAAKVGASNAATVGNLLTANQASIETDTTGFAGEYQCTTARSTAQSASGSASLAVTSTAAGSVIVQTYPFTPGIVAGGVYTAEFSVRAASVARVHQAMIQWLTAGDAFISNSAASVSVVSTTAGFSRVIVTSIAPATTAKASVVLNTFGVAAAGEAFYFDNLGFWAGAGGEWAMPGTPIPNLGTRNNAGVQELWNGTAWVPMAALASPALTGNPTAPTPAAGDNDTSIATTAFAAERATVGNLLTANQASIETDTTGFNTFRGTLASVAASATHGSRSLQYTQTDAAGFGTIYLGMASSGTGQAYSFPVTPGQVYTARAMMSSADNTRLLNFTLRFFGAVGGSPLASTAAGAVAASTTAREFSVTAIAPAGATLAAIEISLGSAGVALGHTFNFDAIGFWAGAGGEWAMPGTPIANLGTRNNAGVQELWNGTAWVPMAPLASPAFTGNPTAPTPAASDNDTSIATTAFAAERATVGNLLTANQASGTDTLGTVPLSTDVPAYYTVAGTAESSTDYARLGSRSLKVTSTGGSTGPNFGTSGGPLVGAGRRISAVAGMPYTAAVSVLAPSATRALNCIHYFYDAAGTSTGQTTTTFAATSSSWAAAFATVSAPAGTEYVGIRWYITSAISGELYYFDKLGVWAGAGGEWAMPGTPIANLGTKVSHPNVDDVLVQRWDSSKATPGWQTIHYDSGVRALDGLLVNGWMGDGGGESCTMRRILSTVYISFQLNTAGSAAVIMSTLPAGFLPINPVYGVVVDPNNGSIRNTLVAWAHNSSSFIRMYGTPSGANAFSLVLTTAPAIPTSLPGTLVSAAPA